MSVFYPSNLSWDVGLLVQPSDPRPRMLPAGTRVPLTVKFSPSSKVAL